MMLTTFKRRACFGKMKNIANYQLIFDRSLRCYFRRISCPTFPFDIKFYSVCHAGWLQDSVMWAIQPAVAMTTPELSAGTAVEKSISSIQSLLHTQLRWLLAITIEMTQHRQSNCALLWALLELEKTIIVIAHLIRKLNHPRNSYIQSRRFNRDGGHGFAENSSFFC